MTPLRQRMLDALELRGMAARTQQSYSDALARLARHYNCSPAGWSAEQVQAYLLHLVRERQGARSSVNQAGCAFRFLYGTVLGLEGEAFHIPLGRAAHRLPESSRARSSRACLPCATAARALLMTAYAQGCA